ncbi:MAG: DNA replication and repair protein RecF [bacterium]
MIKSIHLQNIRNFKDSHFEFKSGVNLVVGRNSSGKTTLLESIGYFAFGKFLSVGRDALVVAAGEEAGRVEADFFSSSVTRAEVGLSAKEKIIKIDERRSRASDLVGLAPQVFFNPETVMLVFDAPALRRRELDMVLSQADHHFVLDMLTFRKVLKERNALLRLISLRQASRKELDFWDERFSDLARRIYQKRVDLLDFFREKINKFYQSLRGGDETLDVKYIPSLDYDRVEETLLAKIDGDIETGSTSIGPHRDDFIFLLNNQAMRDGASRGEQRLAAVAFKATACEFLTDLGIKPLIVLDDVFSELDLERQHSVAETLNLSSAKQVFISATGESFVPDELTQKANRIDL